MPPPRLDSYTLTNADADWINWHDSTIHGVLALPRQQELVLDVDCVLAWEAGHRGDPTGFWVAAATVVFRDVTRVVVDLLMPVDREVFDLEGRVDDELLSEGDGGLTQPGSLTWTIQGPSGYTQFLSTGYVLYFRTAPMLCESQTMSDLARGGVFFDRKVYERSPDVTG